ncbi:MAG: phosphopyruvate hydratase, partial [Patescibacteria group bacterium]
MNTITDIRATTIPDSRGKPTLSVTVFAGDAQGSFSDPSGASTGSHEARELRDADGGEQIEIVHVERDIKPALLGMDVADQSGIDAKMIELDGTPDKSRLGGNALIGVSIAAAKAAAAARGMQTFEHLRTLADIAPSRRVPLLYMNYINGGKHAKSPLSFQEHLIVPETESVAESLAMASDIGAQLEKLISEKYGADTLTNMGDEGGYV